MGKMEIHFRGLAGSTKNNAGATNPRSPLSLVLEALQSVFLESYVFCNICSEKICGGKE